MVGDQKKESFNRQAQQDLNPSDYSYSPPFRLRPFPSSGLARKFDSDAARICPHRSRMVGRSGKASKCDHHPVVPRRQMVHAARAGSRVGSRPGGLVARRG